MKRNFTIDDLKTSNFQELATQIAYHEAGHATAIYLYNKQQQLPPIFFQIHIKSPEHIQELIAEKKYLQASDVAAAIEGGCLIENIALNLPVSSNEIPSSEKTEYLQALDADVVNLLAGSLAEKNYQIQRDNEVINADLLNIETLSSYGNHSDMQKVNIYLNTFSDCPLQRQQKLSQLLKQSFNFITHRRTWKAVEAVAAYILESQKQQIHCEEIFKVVDATLVTTNN